MTDKIYEGDSGPIWNVGFQTSAEGVEPVVLADMNAGFTCRMAVKGSTILRTITAISDDDNYFQVSLTPAETLALGRGNYTVGIELANASMDPPLVQETHKRIAILNAIVPPA